MSSAITMPKLATDFTSENIKQLKRSMPQNIEREREFAMRGFIAGWPEALIEKNKGGTPSVYFEHNEIIGDEAHDTVNPLWWEHSKVRYLSISLKEGALKGMPVAYRAPASSVRPDTRMRRPFRLAP